MADTLVVANGVSEDFATTHEMDSDTQASLFEAFTLANPEPTAVTIEALEKQKEEEAARLAAEAAAEEDADLPSADDEDECFSWGIGDTPADFRSYQETHFDCLDKFDDQRKEDDDPATAEAFEEEMIQRTDRWTRHDMLMVLSDAPPAANTSARMIGGGFGSEFAACAVVEAGVDTHGALDDEAMRRKEAEDYAEATKADARAATALNQLGLLQSVFVKNAEADPYVHEQKDTVKRCIQRHKKKLTKEMRAESERVRKLQELNQADPKLEVHEQVKADVKKMTGRDAASDGNIMEKHPELKSTVTQRPVGTIQVFTLTSVVSADKKKNGAETVEVRAPEELRQEFVRVELQLYRDGQKPERKARFMAHHSAMLSAARCADALLFDLSEDAEHPPSDADLQLALNAADGAESLSKRDLRAIKGVRVLCAKRGIVPTVGKQRMPLHQLLGDGDDDNDDDDQEIHLDAIRLSLYNTRLLLAARDLPVEKHELNSMSRRMGYGSFKNAIQGDVDDLINTAEELLQDRTVGKRWTGPEFEPLPSINVDEYDVEDNHSFPAQLYFLPVAGNKAGHKPEWVKPQTHAGVVRTTGAMATHGTEVAVGSMRAIRVYNMPTGKKVFTLKLSPVWGGRITSVSINEHFICATMDYPERRLTDCDAFVYHRASKTLRLLDVHPLRVTTVEPDPHRESFWFGTNLGVVYCLNWETNELDMRLQSFFMTATQSPVKRISRVGRRIHVLTCTDMFSHEVEPLSDEYLHEMMQRAGKPRQSRLQFPAAHTRFGVADFVLLRNYEVRMLLNGGASVVRMFAAPKELQRNRDKLEPHLRNQHIEYRGGEDNRLYVMYGNGRVRVMWPGPTASQYEDPKARADRLRLQRLLSEKTNVDSE